MINTPLQGVPPERLKGMHSREDDGGGLPGGVSSFSRRIESITIGAWGMEGNAAEGGRDEQLHRVTGARVRCFFLSFFSSFLR